MEIILFWTKYPTPFGGSGCNIAIVVSELVGYLSILTMIAFTTERSVLLSHESEVHKILISNYYTPLAKAITFSINYFFNIL